MLNGLSNQSGTLLTAFHNTVESRAIQNGTPLASLQVLKQQLPTYKDTLKDLSVAAQTKITTRQKDINREFVPVVAETMHQVYEDCEGERGPGQYVRMKALMSRHVDGVRHQMFQDSTNAVKKSLKKLVKDVEDFMLGKADEVFISVKRDYEAVVLGRHAASAQQLPREHQEMQTDVNDIVEGTELEFKKVLGLELATPQPEPELSTETPQDVKDEAMAGTDGAEDAGTGMKDEAEDEGLESSFKSAAETTEQSKMETEAPASPPVSPAEAVLSTEQESEPIERDTVMQKGAVGVAAPWAEPSATDLVHVSVEAFSCADALQAQVASQFELEEQKLSILPEEDQQETRIGEADGRGRRGSSVASWVQSWFSG